MTIDVDVIAPRCVIKVPMLTRLPIGAMALLSCGQLKQVAGTLATMRGTQPLVEAADELLGNPRQLAWVRR